MAAIPASVDYTDRDFDSLRARLIALVKSVFPDWSDFDVASFGNVLLELFAEDSDADGEADAFQADKGPKAAEAAPAPAPPAQLTEEGFDASDAPTEEKDDMALGCLPPSDPLRRAAHYIIELPSVDALLMTSVILSSASLAFDTPRLDESTLLAEVLAAVPGQTDAVAVARDATVSLLESTTNFWERAWLRRAVDKVADA